MTAAAKPKLRQEEIPEHFNNLWQVAGCPREYEHARRLCRALGYEKDDDGFDRVSVEFVEAGSGDKPERALIHPHMLIPVRRASSPA